MFVEEGGVADEANKALLNDPGWLKLAARVRSGADFFILARQRRARAEEC